MVAIIWRMGFRKEHNVFVPYKNPITERQWMMKDTSFITSEMQSIYLGSIKPVSEGEPGSLEC